MAHKKHTTVHSNNPKMSEADHPKKKTNIFDQTDFDTTMPRKASSGVKKLVASLNCVAIRKYAPSTRKKIRSATNKKLFSHVGTTAKRAPKSPATSKNTMKTIKKEANKTFAGSGFVVTPPTTAVTEPDQLVFEEDEYDEDAEGSFISSIVDDVALEDLSDNTIVEEDAFSQLVSMGEMPHNKPPFDFLDILFCDEELGEDADKEPNKKSDASSIKQAPVSPPPTPSPPKPVKSQFNVRTVSDLKPPSMEKRRRFTLLPLGFEAHKPPLQQTLEIFNAAMGTSCLSVPLKA